MILPPLTPATLTLYSSLIKEGISLGVWTVQQLKLVFGSNPHTDGLIKALCDSADAKDSETLAVLSAPSKPSRKLPL